MESSLVRAVVRELAAEQPLILPQGEIATYIPELAKVDPSKFGFFLEELSGQGLGFGDAGERFSIQSICKVFLLTFAFSLKGESLWSRVGVEPSGTAFNSLVQLEYEKGIPRNPLINAGAMVLADILLDELDHPSADFLQFVRKIAQNEDIHYNEAVRNSEKLTGFKNAALVNLMKNFGNIRNDVEAVLDFYFGMCSIEMSCRELAKAFLLYANYGKIPGSGEEIVSSSKCKRINAVMQTCGFYDEAGEFSFRVGLPGKSGVGGGIAAVHPGRYAVAVWSPRLNARGNSWMGMEILERLTTKLGYSIF